MEFDTQAQNVSSDEQVTNAEQVVPSTSMAVTLDQLISLAIEQYASDIHFGEGGRVALRVGGKIVFIENIASLSKESANAMIFSMLPDEVEQKRLKMLRELDFSYTHSSGVSFRVNAFYKQGRLSVVMRMISKHLSSIDNLGIPGEVKKLLPMREGLILVCGPAGSGKSTSIQSMLEYINQNFVKHVITVENPIEYVFEEKKCIFSQREVGKDTLTTENALQSAVREDPNVIMVSDIDDQKVLDNVLTLVETGHLVIASLSTKDSRQTIEKMVNMYHQSQQKQVQERISDNLIAVLSQDLVDRAEQSGRVGVFELLLNTQNIRNIIKQGNLTQLRTAMQSAADEGMVTMDTYAYQLASQGVISQESVMRFID